jgi:hypothetical protein
MVFAQVKGLIARKVVKNDRLELGVMTFDGKGTWFRADGKKVEGACQSAYDADGSSLQAFGALRATLTSSSVCPCVGQKIIGSKEAALVTDLGRFYLFGLKGNQPHLHDLACDHRHYSIGKPLAQTTERYRGHVIVRDMHWSIENGCNWTMDVVLGEDDSQPCQASKDSIETVSWLRVIGYNAVSAWRQQSLRRDQKPISWNRAMETLRDAFLFAPLVDHNEDIQRVT